MAQYIYGKNSVLSALSAQRVIRVFLSPSFSDAQIINELNKRKIKPERKGNEYLDRLASGVHQGVVAEVFAYEYLELKELIVRTKKEKYPLLVMLDGISDPHNLGAILRNVDALGGHGIILKRDNQVSLNATVAKVSSGAIDHVSVTQVTNLSAAIKDLKEAGYWIVSSSGDGKIDYRDFDYKSPIVLVVGSEGEGVSRLVMDNSDVVVKIPLIGHVNSLNASAATALLLAQIFNSRFPL